MSSQIYFTDKNSKKSLQWYLVRIVSEIYRRLLPHSASKQTRSLLLKPQRLTSEINIKGLNEYKVGTPYGNLNCYELGNGPVVLFIHGWSGAGHQFISLMKFLASVGYKSISFDHYGHGKSDSKEASLPLLIKGIKYIDQHINNQSRVEAVVSHSVGSIASINAFSETNTPQFLVAPLFDFMNSLYQRVLQTGLTPVLLNNLIKEIEQEHDVDFDLLDINPKVKNYKGRIEILHDARDRFSKYNLSQKTVQMNRRIQLHTTKGLGHIQILKSEEAKRALAQFLSAP